MSPHAIFHEPNFLSRYLTVSNSDATVSFEEAVCNFSSRFFTVSDIDVTPSADEAVPPDPDAHSMASEVAIEEVEEFLSHDRSVKIGSCKIRFNESVEDSSS